MASASRCRPMPRAVWMAWTVVQTGLLAPRSMRLTAPIVMPAANASSSWLMPCWWRRWRMAAASWGAGGTGVGMGWFGGWGVVGGGGAGENPIALGLVGGGLGLDGDHSEVVDVSAGAGGPDELPGEVQDPLLAEMRKRVIDLDGRGLLELCFEFGTGPALVPVLAEELQDDRALQDLIGALHDLIRAGVGGCVASTLCGHGKTQPFCAWPRHG